MKTRNDILSKQADILIRPELGDIGIFDDHMREELYKAGIEAANKALPKIKKKLSEIK